MAGIHELVQREVRDLPWSEYRATVVVELCRVPCPDCGPRMEKVAQLPSKAPFSKRFEEAVGQACESASARHVAKTSLAWRKARFEPSICGIWSAGAPTRRKPALRQMGVDEIIWERRTKFLTVVSNLETGEPLWFGRERKKETLDEFFRSQLSGATTAPDRSRLRRHVGAVHGQYPALGAELPRSSMTSFTLCSTPTRPSTKSGGPSSSARWRDAGYGERETLAAADALGESDTQAAGTKPTFCAEPEES